MVDTFFNFALIYINIAPDGKVTKLADMTDKKYKALPNKNGIYKAIYFDKPYSVNDIRKVITEEKERWDSARRNTFLIVTGLSVLSIYINTMVYLGLRDANLKIDSNCPHPNSFVARIMRYTADKSVGKLKAITTDGSEIYFKTIVSDDDLTMSLDRDEDLTGLTPIEYVFQREFRVPYKVLKKSDNTLFPDLPSAVGGYRTVPILQNVSDSSSNLFFYGNSIFAVEMPAQNFTKVSSLDDVLQDGEFCHLAMNSSEQVYGAQFKTVQIKKDKSTVPIDMTYYNGCESLNLLRFKKVKSAWSNKFIDTPKIRLLVCKNGSAHYFDTNLDHKAESKDSGDLSVRYYVDEVLALNNGNIVLANTRGVYKLFNGVRKIYQTGKDPAVPSSMLRIPDKTDVGFEKLMSPSDISQYPVLNLTTAQLNDESNYQIDVNEDNDRYSWLSLRFYAWK